MDADKRLATTAGINNGNSPDKLHHARSVAYYVELVLLNKHQFLGGRAYLDCYLDNFVRYMDVRATITGELDSWTKREYSIARRQDGSSCGVLALMAAEAIICDVPLAIVDVTAVAFYRRYIKARMLLNSSSYDNCSVAVCDMRLCKDQWQEDRMDSCDRCDRWLHNVCVGHPASFVARRYFQTYY